MLHDGERATQRLDDDHVAEGERGEAEYDAAQPIGRVVPEEPLLDRVVLMHHPAEEGRSPEQHDGRQGEAERLLPTFHVGRWLARMIHER